MAVTGTDISTAKSFLEEGHLVGIPTETVYGLAANAFNEAAVVKVFEAKNRPSFDPLIVHTHAIEAVKNLVIEFPEKAKLLAETLWPGPLTLLLRKNPVISDLVTSGMDTVAIRIPNQPLILQLLRSLDFPLVAPSANPFGYVSPTTAKHVNDQLGSKISYILDGGPCQVGIESTIVGFEGEEAIIYRMGGTSKAAIEDIIGPVRLMPHSSSNPQAPGMLKSHYSPGKKMILCDTGDIEKLSLQYAPGRTGVIAFNKAVKDIDDDKQVILAEDGNTSTAARHLFAALRSMDRNDIDIILAELIPEDGLGPAVNDRLRRAAAG